MSVEPLAGFGIAHGETQHTNQIRFDGFGRPHPEPDGTLTHSSWMAVVLGVDVSLPIATHVVIVPAARLYALVGRDTDPPQLGMGSVILRVGGGLQFAF